MKGKIIAACLFIGMLSAKAQTNMQVLYDFSRHHITSTLEMFKDDHWGNTFFFVDMDYDFRTADNKQRSVSGAYTEIARCFNFWQESALSNWSLQVEYNGGNFAVGNTYLPVKNAWLTGVDYFMHSKDFSKTLNIKLLYKNIIDTEQALPLQLTTVWNTSFLNDKLIFSGFADYWWENQTCYTTDGTGRQTKGIFISEPQLWYNIGSLCGVENLFIGTEVELSCHFASTFGWKVRPCIGSKWVF